MTNLHDFHFPGESEAYRKIRNQLLQEEINLRQQTEKVAALRRQLPLGGRLTEDYLFEESGLGPLDQNGIKQTRLSELFEPGKSTLIIYSFMYGPDMAAPCPSCTSILDGLNGMVAHVQERVNFVVVAKSPIERIRAWAHSRGWSNLRLLSSFNNSYNADYLGENSTGGQIPTLNVFQKSDDGVFHCYNTELLYTPPEAGQGPRHVDSIWPLWNLFDFTPEGRGADWNPRLAYD